MNNEAVYRTAPATPGLLKINHMKTLSDGPSAILIPLFICNYAIVSTVIGLYMGIFFNYLKIARF